MAAFTSLTGTSRRLTRTALLAILALLALGNAAPTAEDLRQWHAREVRVETITYRLLAANVAICSSRRIEHGGAAVSIHPSTSPAVRALWLSAFNVTDISTVITVLPNSPASEAGLVAGDAIIGVNGAAWTQGGDDTAYRAALRDSLSQAVMTLTVRRGGTTIPLTITGREICDATIRLRNAPTVYAEAAGKIMYVNAGTEALFPDDDRLAFVIAHEAAHVILGHSTPEQLAVLRARPARRAAEQAADALAVRLMARAGYAPDAAALAHAEIARAGRGFFGRLLDIHGPYMATRERIAFLREQAAQAAAEVGTGG